MRRFTSTRRFAVLALLFALSVTAFLVVPNTAVGQSDCDNQCYDGNWQDIYWICMVGDTPYNCSYCQAICPGGGGGGIQPEHQ